MSLFNGLFRSRDKPQNRTAGSSYSFFMGGTTSGKAVTERSAMQMTAVYSCGELLYYIKNKDRLSTILVFRCCDTVPEARAYGVTPLVS